MLQLAFPEEINPNFSWEKSQWSNTVVKKQKHKSYMYILSFSGWSPTGELPLCGYSRHREEEVEEEEGEGTSGKSQAGA